MGSPLVAILVAVGFIGLYFVRRYYFKLDLSMGQRLAFMLGLAVGWMAAVIASPALLGH